MPSTPSRAVRLVPALCSVTFRGLAPSAIIDLAASAGIAAVEWGADIHVPPGDLAAARNARALTEGRGLRIASYGSYWRPGDRRGDAVLVETAANLGAGNIRIWPGFPGRDSDDYTADERRAVADDIRAVATAAAAAGITLGLEYHPKTLTDRLDSAAALLTEIDHPNVFTYWQPRPGLPLEIARAEVKTLAADISHLHVFQWDAAATRYPLAQGREYWRAILDDLQPGRWQGERYAMIEFVAGDDAAQFRDDAGELLRMLDGTAGAATP